MRMTKLQQLFDTSWIPAARLIRSPVEYDTDEGNAVLVRQMKNAKCVGTVDGYDVYRKGTNKERFYVVKENERIIVALRYNAVTGKIFPTSGFSETYVWTAADLDLAGLPRRIFWDIVWPDMKHLFILDDEVSQVGFNHALALCKEALAKRLIVLLYSIDTGLVCYPTLAELEKHKKALFRVLVNEWDDAGKRGLAFGSTTPLLVNYDRCSTQEFWRVLLNKDAITASSIRKQYEHII